METLLLAQHYSQNLNTSLWKRPHFMQYFNPQKNAE